MNRVALAAIASAGCATTPEPVAIDAAAELVPLPGADILVAGPIEVLGAGMPPVPHVLSTRTLSAMHVQLPGSAAPWVRIYMAPSCGAPGPEPAVFADLGLIRRVGDEIHFFMRDVVVGDRMVDIDTQTAAAPGLLEPELADQDLNLIGKLAVVQAPGADPGPDPGRPAPGGAWLSCGVFALRYTRTR